MEKYIAQLTKKEIIAMAIAKRMLGSSFNIEKSIGYIVFKKHTPLP
jgi:hypothetical protein